MFNHPFIRLQFILALVFSGTSCLQATPPMEEETRTIQHKHETNQGLEVQSLNGAITVNQSDRSDVQIVAHLKATTTERLKATKIIVERSGSGTLKIHAAWPKDRVLKGEGCSFEVLIPDAKGLQLRSSNGPLTVSDLEGTAELETSNGSIKVTQHEGSVNARTSNGKIQLSKINGSIETRSSNGQITISEAATTVKARTSNGPIQISLAETSSGPVDVKTTNGQVEIGVGSSFGGTLSLATSNGTIKSEEISGARFVKKGKRKAQLTFAKSGRKSSATTSNGQIQIRNLSK